ncbi:baseplate J/gp47 family protein [Flammeovirga agarivorans]|uniref:Uncharacterized protein n=1 Tax=Flammeovirga agarivorans TaxID=2726742 RepID=A0A7X8SR37_9BACT|nr:hypothetical protein [Flammeovirga agarivorans]NLR94856.1 hypothetical protein [Flammeovirga agarivorans]
MTKNELISRISKLDYEVIKQIYDYSTLSLKPSLANLTSVTSKQLVEKAHEYADTHFPEWTDRSASDFGQFLVEIFAQFSEKDFWYLNNFASNSLVYNTNDYTTAFIRSIYYGHTPKRYSPVILNISMTVSAGEEYLIPKGELRLSLDDLGLIAVNRDPIKLVESNVSRTMNAFFSVGEFNTYSAEYLGKEIFLPDTDIDYKTISVEIEGENWTFLEDFFGEASSKVFTAFPRSEASYNLHFGDNIFGQRPNIGSLVKVDYLTAPDRVSYVDPTSNVSVVSNPSSERDLSLIQVVSSTKQTEEETLADLKKNCAVGVSVRNGITNKKSCEILVNSIPEILKSNAQIVLNTVTVRILLTSTEEATEEDRENLLSEIADFIPAGYDFYTSKNEYVELEDLTVTLYVISSVDIKEACKSASIVIKDSIARYIDGGYGVGVDATTIRNALAAKVRGFTNISIDSINNKAISNLSISEFELLTDIYAEEDEETFERSSTETIFRKGNLTIKAISI